VLRFFLPGRINLKEDLLLQAKKAWEDINLAISSAPVLKFPDFDSGAGR
jgi:hypothetical protein